MVLWLTGLSGSGKTTLASALKERLGPRFAGLVVLDGDQVRAAFGDGLGHGPEDRVVQVTRVQRLARLLSDQGLMVIVALVYQNPALLSWNRDRIRNYYEVHIDCSLETVKRRDTKGLYAAYERGEMEHVVGCDIPWVPPRRPDFVINGDAPPDPSESAKDILSSIPRLARDPGES
jgi:adenylylsulfate kinase